MFNPIVVLTRPLQAFAGVLAGVVGEPEATGDAPARSEHVAEARFAPVVGAVEEVAASVRAHVEVIGQLANQFALFNTELARFNVQLAEVVELLQPVEVAGHRVEAVQHGVEGVQHLLHRGRGGAGEQPPG